MKDHSAGRITYETTFVARGPADPQRLLTLRHNTPLRRVVHFDGRSSRTEAVSTEYGFRSLSLRLRGPGEELYCKQLHYLAFCVAVPPRPEPLEGQPPVVRPREGARVIAGFAARGLRWERGSERFDLWHAPEVTVADPTGAVDQLPGAPGLLLERLEVPLSERAEFARRVTVTEVSWDPPAPSLFVAPAGYRRMASIEAARAEDRRLLEAAAAAERYRRPLSPAEESAFAGRWRLEGAPGAAAVEIIRAEGEYRWRAGALVERGTLAGRQLLVEEPPNYRLYRLEAGGTIMVLVGDDELRYRRAD